MPGFRPQSKHKNYGVVLAGTMNERDIDKVHHFFDGCCLVCSPVLTPPCVRNTFVIKSADCQNRDGHNLKFGQEFLLQVNLAHDWRTIERPTIRNFLLYDRRNNSHLPAVMISHQSTIPRG
ncbi:uncharacterized protein LOC125502272 [Athalia rosae]|uniref:uncharacterized protein LOC125502272 n=1 Tax=Athalia rosae TaxID=37344 RepID=UPI00203388CF|nr:uncharacterized protein LOC125502272 [Athalia rosae]